ncbi:MAG: NERD domain-containing protein [Chloroflexota bacterium]|nr:NERD domain-containing protein [Chloroflexota bacterium]
MKIYTNKRVIEKYQKRGIRFSVAGLLVMGVAFILVWWPAYAYLAWPLLLVGVTISMIGTYYVNRWLRPPLPEPVMEEAFQRFNARYVLFHHTGLVPHLLLTPKGLIVIKAKRYEGPVRYNAETEKWKGKFSIRRFYGHGLTAETLGDPAEEVRQLEEHVRAWLQLNLPDVAEQVPVEGIALFLPPKTEFHVADSPLPLAQPDTIKKVVQQLFSKRKPLPRAVYNRLRDALEAELPDDLEEAA